ncbi:MAG: phenylalanine 4-monooxygenase [Flavobacteriales bacterium]|nr:phenylalanine 4-monooxygenase [Flavobacteriales bacterium]
MNQNYSSYTAEDHEVWKTLFERQHDNLQDKACKEYLTALDELKLVLNSSNVPNFDALNVVLKRKTGWSIEVVKGLIPPEDFFHLLEQKRFCSSTWLRTMNQLDYLEEPDMFHDIFGHIPLLMNEDYANFMFKFGQLGNRHFNNKSIVKILQRIYWFTIEFGLMKAASGATIYGAGIASSFGESIHALSNTVNVKAFNLEEIIAKPFCTTKIQTTYYAINSFDELYQSVKEFEEIALIKI